MTERKRGSRLRRIREQWLRSNPLCVHCLAKGRIKPAEELDHIIALTNGGKDFDEDNGENRQGLCKECHKAKTAKDKGHTRRPAIGLDGWPTEE